MRIRLTTDRAGRDGFFLEGQVIDLPRDEALRLVAARQADLVEAVTATAPPEPDRAISRKPPRRK